MKVVWEKIKWIFGTAGFWIVSIAGFLFGYVYYLLTKNDALRTKVEILQNKESQRKWWENYAKTKEDADHALADYERLKAEYLKGDKLPGGNNSSGRGDSGKTG